VPFKLNQDRRHHIPRQQHKITNWPAYEAGLRQRGSAMVRSTDNAIAGLGGGTADDARSSSLVLAVGDPDGADVARRVPPRLSAG
jgi:hypothetical protein